MQATSMTHQHALGVILAEGLRFDPGTTIRILDAGCGNGSMIKYLQIMLPQADPSRRWELYGYDVADHGVQTNPEFISEAVRELNTSIPEIQWEQRIATISVKEAWPYKDGAFDVIISNQVVEHLNEPIQFFSELHRCLQPKGFSAHIFPLKTQLHETHIRVPFAHWIINHQLLHAWIKFWNRVGFGRYKTYNQPGDTFEQFCEKEADRITYYTRYMKYREFLQLGKDLSFRPSFRYSQDIYYAKLRALFRMQPRLAYKAERNNFVDWWFAQLLKFGPVMTFFLDKNNSVAIKYADSKQPALVH